MPPVAVRILHAEAGPNAGPLERTLIAARAELAERHRRGFLASGAADVRVVAGPPDGISFGERLRGLAAEAVHCLVLSGKVRSLVDLVDLHGKVGCLGGQVLVEKIGKSHGAL